MNISIFDVAGPIMIGPSSSHTAGAAKLARIAGIIAKEPFSHVSFGLHGSFAKTYKGHGTDRALVAGALGMREDDECLVNAFEIAQQKNIGYNFYETTLDDMHENSVKIVFTLNNGKQCVVIGSSIGGAQIVIKKINEYEVDYTALSPALFILHNDRVGVISEITHILSENRLNIAVMKLSRKTKGGKAFCTIEPDSFIDHKIASKISALPNVIAVQAINIDSKKR